MPCRVVRFGGAEIIVCSRGRSAAPCYVCGKHGDLFCDWPVTRNGTAGICDKRMCRRCANEVGPDKHYCNAHYRMYRNQGKATSKEVNQ